MTTIKCSLRSFAATLLATATLFLALPSQNLLAQCDTAGTTFAGGTGTEGDPFQISTIVYLNNIRNNSGGCNYLEKHFVLTKDLDFEDTDGSGADYVYSTASDAENDKGWLPIGHDTDKNTVGNQGTAFTGSFDGGGYVIHNLSVSRSDEDYVGFFGVVGAGGSVENLGLENLDVSGRNRTGGLVGITSAGDSTISSCYTAGNVSGNNLTGGLAGESAGTITLCYSSARVTGSGSAGGLVGSAKNILSSSYSVGDVTGTSQVGGLVGVTSGGARSCYSTGSVTGTGFKVGGFAGVTSIVTLTSCYSTGNATGKGIVGGFVGESLSVSATSCYSTGTATATSGAQEGGFVGNNLGLTRTNTYWENTGTAIDDAVDLTDRTPTQMKALTATLSMWNALSWNFGTSDQYPALRTYKVNDSDVQVQGDVIAGQPCPRVECDPFGGGTGTADDPHQISTIAHLNAIRGDFLDDHFILMNDLDFAGTVWNDSSLSGYVSAGWLPIGHDTSAGNPARDGTAFTGSFDGQGNILKGLRINQEENYWGGLFGQLSGSVVNLGMVDVNIVIKEKGGGIAGECQSCKIISCYSTGEVSGSANIGGIAGSFAGFSANPATINKCYSTASVTASALDAGGIVSNNTTATISSCYSTGEVSSGGRKGGLVAYNLLGTVTDSFWDKETSGISVSDGGGTGKTTEQMKALTLADLGDGGGLSWDVGTSDQYPALKTYKEMPADTQVEGDLLGGQPCPRAECDPHVSIAAGTSPVTEGMAAEFTLTRTGSTAAGLTVAIMVTGGDDFLSGTPLTEVVFGAGAAMKGLSLATAVDEMDEADGTVTVTITADPSSYSGGDASASVDIADDDPILVSITGTTSAEGAGAVFTLMRARAEAGALAVKVTVDGGAGDFLTDPLVVTEGGSTTALALVSGSVTVTIAADQDSQTFTVSTDDDTADEADGTVTATITAEADGPYRVHATDAAVLMAAASVAVEDDDLPLVSIAAGTASVTEGTAAEFTLTRVGVTTEALTVMVAVTGGTGFLSGAAPTEASFGAGDATTTLSVATEGDDMDEADGTLTVTVTVTVASYRVDAGNPSATVTVTDDDDPPVVTALTFSDTVEDQTYTKDMAITDLELPVATGGMGPYMYTLVPVPAGLMFDANTRTLSGMPTAVTDTATTHTYTVTDSTPVTELTKTLTFMITVNEEGTALSFSGTIANQTYTKNTAVTDLELPVATGGMGPYMYTLVPVPAGLMFDANTRTLSGMPTAVTDTATTHTYTVTDSTTDTALTKTLTFTITVNEEGSPTFADTVANQTYTENTAITDLELPIATGGMGALTYTLTPVPDGLEFDATTRTLSGTPTTPTDTATTHTYTVTDSAPDTSLTASLTFTITVSEAETIFGIGSLGAAVHVYPNPAGDVLHIEFPDAGDYGIALLTLTGQPVLGGQHAEGGSQILDLSSLTKGVYFLKVEDSEGVSQTFRIIR